MARVVDLELCKHLGKTVLASDILLLLVCQELEGSECYLSDLSSATGQSDVATRRGLRRLERKGHLVYHVFNRGGTAPGHKILWARRTEEEKTPGALCKNRARAIRLVHPEHGSKTVLHGCIREFARKHDLKYRALRAVISGDRNHHHGWRLKS